MLNTARGVYLNVLRWVFGVCRGTRIYSLYGVKKHILACKNKVVLSVGGQEIATQ